MNLEKCCAEWAAIVGSDNLLTDPSELNARTETTFPWPSQALALLSPQDKEQVRACLAAATTHAVPIYPSSRGRSWGLGAQKPVTDAAILDLSRLDRIIEIDMTLGTAHIEPGVTFASLQQALAEQGLAYHLPSFGGPVDASVLANAVERGEGLGRHGDRFAGLTDIEVLLASGERINTGHARFGNAAAGRLHARPAGPLLDGLFSQSGFGVVVSGRLTLAPTLPYAALVVAEIGPPDKLSEALAKLRGLVIGGVAAPLSVAVWDGSKRLSSLSAARAMSTDMLDDVSALGWGASVFVTAAHDGIFNATLDCIKATLTPVCKEITVHSDRDVNGKRTQSLMTGFSDGRNVASCYAGKKADADTPSQPADLNPERDRCGFLWLCPVLPFSGDALKDVAGLVSAHADAAGIFAAIGTQAASRNAMHGYVSLAWDRDTEGADARAMQCHNAIAMDLMQRGYLPYRLAHPTHASVPKAIDDWPAVAARLRHALDPDGLIAPGRIDTA